MHLKLKDEALMFERVGFWLSALLQFGVTYIGFAMYCIFL